MEDESGQTSATTIPHTTSGTAHANGVMPLDLRYSHYSDTAPAYRPHFSQKAATSSS